ncbi:hypothetical protein ACFWYW_47050 [Nonomuraea sp. NPDC059023]|uniref:hypothetical protein n=1 Tax=unclassified Nonomuraea TaxID=2593643 RepID=UPI00369BC32D
MMTAVEQPAKPREMAIDKLPKAAQDLLALAKNNGWAVAGAADIDTGGNPFVTLLFKRLNPEWEIKVTWHSRATGGKTLRLFLLIWRHVPLQGPGHYWRDAPSLKAIRQVIIDNPV